MNRNERLLSLFDPSGLGLEIGPSYNPLLPKRKGHNVEILDHLDQDGLKARYSGAPGVDLSAIEPVDFVSRGKTIFEAVGLENRYDFIVASHVIEHTIDLIGFLKDCERLLKPAGVLVLAVPDKRFSFDVLRPLTSTGDVLWAHVNPRTSHLPGAVFDEVAYNCQRSGAPAWSPDNTAPLEFFFTLQQAKDAFDAARQGSHYYDIHAWQFTPSSFRLMASDLAQIEAIALRESRFQPNGGEFFMILSRTGQGPAATRMQLAQQAVVEQFEIHVDPARA